MLRNANRVDIDFGNLKTKKNTAENWTVKENVQWSIMDTRKITNSYEKHNDWQCTLTPSRRALRMKEIAESWEMTLRDALLLLNINSDNSSAWWTFA